MQSAAYRFGERLCYLRNLKNMTQAELAEKIGLSQRQISRMEDGVSTPSFGALEKLSRVLETSMANLFLFLGRDAENVHDRPDCTLDGEWESSWEIRVCESSQIGIWTLAPTGCPMRWSTFIYTLLGYAPFSVKPSVARFLEHVPESQRSEVQSFIETVFQGEKGRLMCRLETNPRGKRTILMDTQRVTRTKNDSAGETMLILQDVTDMENLARTFVSNRKALQEHVHEKNRELYLTVERYKLEVEARLRVEDDLRLYELMVSNSTDAQVFVDRLGRITKVNKTYEQLVGESAQYLVGKDYEAVMCEKYGVTFCKNDFRPNLQKALRFGETLCHGEWCELGKSNRVFLQRHYAPCWNNGKTVGVVITIHDLTDTMLTQEKLRESEERFRNLFASVQNVAIKGYNMDGVVHYWNRASEDIYGYTEQEAVGQNLVDLIIPHEMRNETAGAIRNMARTGELVPPSELTLMRKDGSPIDVYSCQAVVNKPGSPVELFCMDIDITWRKQVEESLRQREALLKLAAEGMLELLNSSDLDRVIGDILSRLGSITDTDRVYVFQNRVDEKTEQLYTVQIHEWVRTGITAQIDNPLLLHAELFPRWQEEMESGRAVMGDVRDFPEDERVLFESQEIQSLLAVPILVGGRFWGFLGFDSVRTTRVWAPAKEYILRIVASAIGASIARSMFEKDLMIKDHALSSTLDAIALADLEGRLTYVNQAFLKLWGFEREEDALTRHLWLYWYDSEQAAGVTNRVLEYGSYKGFMIAKKSDGGLFIVHTTVNIVHDKGGKAIGMMGFFREMSEGSM